MAEGLFLAERGIHEDGVGRHFAAGSGGGGYGQDREGRVAGAGIVEIVGAGAPIRREERYGFCRIEGAAAAVAG